MKKVFYFIAVTLLTVLSVQAQKTRVISAGDITANTTWFSDTVYSMRGFIYVKNNATLTIQPGTIIKGDTGFRSTLIITRNGRLNAIGTASSPIVFTSGNNPGNRKPGDWGGIVMLGQAPINVATDCSTCPGAAVAAGLPGVQNNIEGDLDNSNGDGLYGGTNPNHSSGTLRYVRLEYGGVVINPGNEINGLTMGALGKGTTIEYVQVTQANDDAFEWFGGNADAKYLVSHRNIDDDLDVDFGFTGRIQYAIVLRDSLWFDVGQGPTTNGFESDNNAAGSEAQPYTDPTFSNVTLLGPWANGAPLSFSNSFQNGLRIRRNSSTSVFNSVVMGWPAGLFVDGTRTGQKFLNDSMLFRNNIMVGNGLAVNNGSANAANVRTDIMVDGCDTTSAFGTILRAPFNYTNPDFRPQTGSPALTGASFTGAARISDPYFTQGTFRGAIGTTDWTQCWCNFNPQTTNYDAGPINRGPNYDAGRDSTICAGRSVTIGATLTGALRAVWSPSAGLNSTTLARPTATPTATTKYFVTVTDTVTGCSVIDSITISVTPLPVADFTSAAGTGGTFNFTSTSTNATSFAWNFGNGQTSTTQNPSHTYTSNGTYNVVLVATNGTCTSTVNRLITVTGINSPTRAVTGDITSNTTWFRDTIYTMNGFVYVKNATLTIQSGTIVKGGANRGTLIVTRTGKLEANGTKNQPIVFTSAIVSGNRKPGDWGGIILLGQAPINRPTDCSTCPGVIVAGTLPGIQNNIEGDIDNAAGDGLYGGTDANHSSGSITYLRLEFGGVVINPGNEINGLTMGGVGKGTTLSHIQVTQVNDDAFEWFGGNVDAKYLVAHRNIDDDLDVDFGYTGKVQYAIVVRDSTWFDIGNAPTTNGFESDNDGQGTEAMPYTDPTFSNVTLLGPWANGTPLSSANSFQNGLRIRRNSSTSVFNSVIMGWPAGLFLDGTRTGQKFLNDSMSFRNNVLVGNGVAVNVGSANFAAVRSKIMLEGTDTTAPFGSVLVNPFNYNTPNFTPAASSVALSGASFTSAARISDPFFTRTTFRGALGNNPDSNWTDCWCRFNPQAEAYTSAPINYPAPLADFNAGAPTGRTVVFANNSSLATSFFWDFGVSGSTADTSVAQNPSFVFPANGSFTVRLIVKSVCGTSTTTKTVVINDLSSKPVANFTFAQDTTSGSLTFRFTNTTDEKGLPTTYRWDFGVAGGTSTDKNPSFTFPANGAYNVKLVAIGQADSDSITKLVPVIRTSVKESVKNIRNINVYPNPANNLVNVAFTMDKAETVSINVYDVTGKLVKTIGNKEFGAGANKEAIQTEELSSGLYFVNITGAEFSKTTRIMIAK